MIESIVAASTGGVAGREPSTGVFPGDETGKETFLQLLVAQIQNQDPLKPLDPTAFVSQLAQFSALEQLLKIGKSLQAIEGLLEAAGRPPEAGDAAGTQSGGAGQPENTVQQEISI